MTETAPAAPLGPRGARRARSRALIGFAIAIAIALITSACALPERGPAVPEELMLAATVPGIPNARHWIEIDSKPLAQLITAAGQRAAELEAHGTSRGRRPPAYLLALSGGGDNGAFGAGLLVGWTEHGDRPHFTVVTGTSVGALIAPFAFLGPEYDGALRETFTTISQDDIFQQRPLSSALFDDAVTDNAPLRALVAKHVDDEFVRRIAEEHDKGRLLLIGTTNLDARRLIVWDIGTIAKSGRPGATQLIRDVIVASTAIPGVFPPTMIEVEADGTLYQEMHVDGGTIAQVFIYPPSLDLDALIRENSLGRDVILYIIRNAGLDPDYTEVGRRTLTIASRSVSSLIHSQGVGDLFTIYLKTSRDNVDYNLAFIPADFTSIRKQPFDTQFMNALFNYAYELARNGYPWLDRPPGLKGPDLRPQPQGLWRGRPQAVVGTAGRRS